MRKIRLRELREERGLTQIQLAEILKLNNKTLSAYETNKCEPDIDTIEKFCKFFNVPADYFLGFKEE